MNLITFLEWVSDISPATSLLLHSQISFYFLHICNNLYHFCDLNLSSKNKKTRLSPVALERECNLNTRTPNIKAGILMYQKSV